MSSMMTVAQAIANNNQEEFDRLLSLFSAWGFRNFANLSLKKEDIAVISTWDGFIMKNDNTFSYKGFKGEIR